MGEFWSVVVIVDFGQASEKGWQTSHRRWNCGWSNVLFKYFGFSAGSHQHPPKRRVPQKALRPGLQRRSATRALPSERPTRKAGERHRRANKGKGDPRSLGRRYGDGEKERWDWKVCASFGPSEFQRFTERSQRVNVQSGVGVVGEDNCELLRWWYCEGFCGELVGEQEICWLQGAEAWKGAVLGFKWNHWEFQGFLDKAVGSPAPLQGCQGSVELASSQIGGALFFQVNSIGTGGFQTWVGISAVRAHGCVGTQSSLSNTRSQRPPRVAPGHSSTPPQRKTSPQFAKIQLGRPKDLQRIPATAPRKRITVGCINREHCPFHQGWRTDPAPVPPASPCDLSKHRTEPWVSPVTHPENPSTPIPDADTHWQVPGMCQFQCSVPSLDKPAPCRAGDRAPQLYREISFGHVGPKAPYLGPNLLDTLEPDSLCVNLVGFRHLGPFLGLWCCWCLIARLPLLCAAALRISHLVHTSILSAVKRGPPHRQRTRSRSLRERDLPGWTGLDKLGRGLKAE